MSDLHSINEEQRLYVLKCGGGYSCLGFDVALKWTKIVADWLKENRQLVPVYSEANKGTPQGYAEYLTMMRAGGDFNRTSGIRCNGLLEPQLIGLEQKYVCVVDKYDEIRAFQIGKSTGWMPIHLEIDFDGDGLGGSGAYGTPYKEIKIVSKKEAKQIHKTHWG